MKQAGGLFFLLLALAGACSEEPEEPEFDLPFPTVTRETNEGDQFAQQACLAFAQVVNDTGELSPEEGVQLIGRAVDQARRAADENSRYEELARGMRALQRSLGTDEPLERAFNTVYAECEPVADELLGGGSGTDGASTADSEETTEAACDIAHEAVRVFLSDADFGAALDLLGDLADLPLSTIENPDVREAAEFAASAQTNIELNSQGGLEPGDDNLFLAAIGDLDDQCIDAGL